MASHTVSLHKIPVQADKREPAVLEAVVQDKQDKQEPVELEVADHRELPLDIVCNRPVEHTE